MPRIRKKTSNRGSTNERKKILHKVRESRRKTKKAAKKNPQWKSKTPKDPGIPNNFPFKDQILAEVSEQRRIDAAEKLRKKEERKALRAKTKNPAEEDDSDQEEEVRDEAEVEMEELKGLQIGNESIGGVGAKRLMNAKTFSRPAPAPIQEDEDDEEVPVLINHDLPNLQAVLDEADVIIEILDARDPLAFRSSHLEELAAAKPGRRILLVLNKIDTCPRESVAAWATYLRTAHPTVLFRSAAAFLPAGTELSPKVKGKGKAKAPTEDGLGVDSVLKCLGEWAKGKAGDEPLAVAVVGLTNAGKSSFINSLLRKSALPVYTVETSSRGPTTTELPQEVVVDAGGKQIRLIDTPGLSWEADEDAGNIDELRARDILLRAKGRIDRLKDPTLAVANVVVRSSAEDLMLFYSLPAFAKDDPNSFLSGIARSNQLVKKRGELDLIGASRILLRDWSTGRFPRFTLPPKSEAKPLPSDGGSEKLVEAEDAILATLAPRKEMRKSRGLVKLVSGEVESRKAVLDEPWVKETDSSSDEDEDGDLRDDGEMNIEEDDDEDEDEDEDEEGIDDDTEEEEDDEEEALPPASKKQKRKRPNEPIALPPSKKVAFGPDPKISKQSRKAGSLKGKPMDDSVTKPVLHTTSIQKPKPKPTAQKQERKVANVVTKSKITKAITSGADGDEAYDFGKFF